VSFSKFYILLLFYFNLSHASPAIVLNVFAKLVTARAG